MRVNWKQEWKPLAAILPAFCILFYLPLGWPRFDNAVMEALYLARWYAREHVLFCLVPAFFIAGSIAVLLSQASVMKYLGASAPKALACGVASVSGTILAVCSCTVLPLFAGIYRMGAGIGRATAFLYSAPAINVLAIALTARVLGLEMGIARAAGANRLQCADWPADAPYLPERGTGESTARGGDARPGGRTPPSAERGVFCLHAGHSRLCKLGRARRARRNLAYGPRRQVGADGRGLRSLRALIGGLVWGALVDMM